MKLAELKTALKKYPKAEIRFLLPDHTYIASHAHVTEVARIEKHFIDCGGTFRNESVCRLQTWVADDYAHRLHAAKLLGILEKAHSFLRSDDIEVDVEHELTHITQLPIVAIEASEEAVIFKLTTKHTACLAMEKCCPPANDLIAFGKKA